MKKIMLTLAAAFVMTAAMAQSTSTQCDNKKCQKMDPSEMVTKRTQEMVEKYGLSTEQATKLKTLNEKYMGQQGCPQGKPSCDQNCKNTSKNNGQRPEKPANSSSQNQTGKQKPSGGQHGGPDMTAYNTELKAILSDSQYQAYETEMANMKNSKGSKGSKSSKKSK